MGTTTLIRSAIRGLLATVGGHLVQGVRTVLTSGDDSTSTGQSGGGLRRHRRPRSPDRRRANNTIQVLPAATGLTVLHIAQVFQIERAIIVKGRTHHEMPYITSLTDQKASPAGLRA